MNQLLYMSGATQGPESGSAEIVCSSSTGSIITSGGGFSNVEPVPSWQASFTSNYLNSLPSNHIPNSGYNANGRGFPDISVAGHLYETQKDNK